MGIIAACDPGLSGAVAFLDDQSGCIVDIRDSPIRRDYREVCHATLMDWINEFNARLAVVELVQGFGGVSSAFKLAQGYSAFIGAALATRTRLERVRPQTWQSVIIPDAADTKKASVAAASRSGALKDPTILIRKGRTPSHDRADAVNIARYAWTLWK